MSAEYEFVRPLHPGDRLDYVSALESISEEKRTALGPGRFLGYLLTVRDDRGATVGRLRFTNLVHKPQ